MTSKIAKSKCQEAKCKGYNQQRAVHIINEEERGSASTITMTPPKDFQKAEQAS